MSLDDDAQWSRWVRWYEGAHKDIMTLLHNRYIWRNMLAMLQANAEVEHHTIVNDWLTRCYSQAQAVGVRRQSEREGLRPTLGVLLREMELNSTVLTRQRYVNGLTSEPLPNRSIGWTSFAPDDGPYADPALISLDGAKLASATDPVRKWVNRAVAHKDKDRATQSPPAETSFAAINEALDVQARLVRKYYMLFHPGHTLLHVTPDAEPGWIKMFKVPWLPEKFAAIDAWDLG